MEGSVFDFDARELAGTRACVCHGECDESSVRQSAGLRSLLVSSALLRPLFELGAARMLDARREPPSLSQSADGRHLSLLLADRWVEEVVMRLREPALGLMALENVKRGGGSVVELAAERAPRLMDALLMLVRLSAAENEAASLHLHIHGGSAILSVGSLLKLSHSLRDFLVGSLSLSVSRWLPPGTRMDVWFAGPRPSYSPAYRHALGEVSVGFCAPYDALVLPTASLHHAMPLADPKLHDFLVRVARRIALDGDAR